MPARRVDAHSTWDFFWSVSSVGHPQLTLIHNEPPKGKLPTFEGFRVTSTPSVDGRYILSFTLEGNSVNEVFQSLCLDLVRATNSCVTEVSAVESSIDRAWRWHKLLRGTRDPRMTSREQQGFIGELHLISEALHQCNADRVIDSWRAPEDNPKDFIFGDRAFEVKTKRDAHASTLSISSAEQLDSTDFSEIFLFVVNVMKDGPTGETMPTLADGLESRLSSRSQTAATAFRQKLVQRGLWPEHDYSGDRWSIMSSQAYEVTANFPRIESSQLAPGVSGVSYLIELNAIKPFATDAASALMRTFEGDINGLG